MKYIIYKGTGGLVHMLSGIQSAVKIAKEEDRILIIDTEKLTAFKKNFNDYFFIYDKELRYYTDYKNIDKTLKYKELTIDEVDVKKAQFREGKYYLEGTDIRIHKHLDDDKNDLIRLYAGHSDDFIENLRLHNNILYQVFDRSIEKIEKMKKYIGVHFRNTDMKNDIKKFVEKIKKTSDQKKIKNIFIATDDYHAFKIFQNLLPGLNFFRMHEVEDCKGKNIHYHYKDKELLIMSTLIDIYMLIKSKYFIPSRNSGVSKWIIYQKKNENSRLFDDEYNFEIVN